MAVRLPLLLTGNPRSSTGGEVRRAEREQLLVGVDAIAVAGGEGAGGEHVVGVADDRDADRRQQQRGKVSGRHDRKARCRQPGRDLSDDPDALVLQREHGHGGGGEKHPDQRHRCLRGQPRTQQQKGQHRRGQGQRR